MPRFHVISAIFRRNFQNYFSGVIGYLFIVVFVTLCSLLAFGERFFLNNLANLDQLSQNFPLLLLFLIPAITMSTWADEKKTGTDELLFTLPASDFEILLGKYLSVLAVYTTALGFSLTMLIVLVFIGRPDWGVVFTTYLGYWLAGAALLTAGMFASSLTNSTTVAFVLGAILCAVPVFIDNLPGGAVLDTLSVSWQLRDFTIGLIPLTSLLYFVTLAAFMLYLNYVVITRRHWSAERRAGMGVQFAVRVLALGAVLVSWNYMAERSSAYFSSRVDVTEERLYTLSDTTLDIIDKAVEEERKVLIQAYVSKDVPREYVPVRKQLIGLLRQYNRQGGTAIDVRLIDVEPHSDASQEARKQGIEPETVNYEREGRTIEQDVYLGLVFTSNVDETKIPLLGTDSSMEYEITRAIGAVLGKEDESARIKVGILQTDANFGAIIQRDDRELPGHFQQTMDIMRTYFDVYDVSTDDLKRFIKDGGEKSEDGKDEDGEDSEEEQDEQEDDDANVKQPDVLLVAAPSSLTESAMDDLVVYIEGGGAALLLADPLPFYYFTYRYPQLAGVINAPRQERPMPERSPLAFLVAAPQQQKLRLEMLLQRDQQLQAEVRRLEARMQTASPEVRRRLIYDFFESHPHIKPEFEPKADDGKATRLLKAIGVKWNSGEVLYDLHDPHPGFQPKWPDAEDGLGSTWPEAYGPKEALFTFVGSPSEEQPSFHRDSVITGGLQEMMLFYGGVIEQAKGSKLTFTPLLRSSENSAVMEWDDATRTPEVRMPAPRDLRQTVTKAQISVATMKPLRLIRSRPIANFDEDTHVMAAHIKDEEEDGKINVVFVTDYDFVSDLYFEQEERIGRKLDNMVFLLNAVEVLAGDATYAELRNRRARPRTLTRIQTTVDAFRRKRAKEQAAAEEKMRKELAKLDKQLETKREELAEDESLGFLQRLERQVTVVQAEQRKRAIKQKELEQELGQKIDALKAEEQSSIGRLQTRVRVLAVLLPPIPALLVGIFVLALRVKNERREIQPSRRIG